MADLSRDRGQILLIAALTLAVIFVGLALVVNGAIFTQNLASQGESSGGGQMLELRSETTAALGETLDHVNRNGSEDFGDLQTEFERNLTQFAWHLGNYTLFTGRSVSLTATSAYQQGRYIEDVAGPSNDFQSAAGDESWQVASFVDRTRDLEFYVQSSEKVYNNTNGFTLVVNTTTQNLYTLKIGNRTLSDDGPALEVRDIPNNTTRVCELVGHDYPVELDVMGAQFGGEYCSALDDVEFATGASGTYRLFIQNGQNLEGNYSMLVSNTTAGDLVNLPSSNYGTEASAAPFNKTAIYSTVVNFTVRSDNLVYNDEVRIAPGEAND